MSFGNQYRLLKLAFKLQITVLQRYHASNHGRECSAAVAQDGDHPPFAQTWIPAHRLEELVLAPWRRLVLGRADHQDLVRPEQEPQSLLRDWLPHNHGIVPEHHLGVDHTTQDGHKCVPHPLQLVVRVAHVDAHPLWVSVAIAPTHVRLRVAPEV